MDSAERVDLYNRYYEACTPEERIELDKLVARLVLHARVKRAKNFGPEGAKELLVSLVLWREQHEKEFQRQKALGRKENALRFS